jgi:hypothetical protein
MVIATPPAMSPPSHVAAEPCLALRSFLFVSVNLFSLPPSSFET